MYVVDVYYAHLYNCTIVQCTGIIYFVIVMSLTIGQLDNWTILGQLDRCFYMHYDVIKNFSPAAPKSKKENKKAPFASTQASRTLPVKGACGSPVAVMML